MKGGKKPTLPELNNGNNKNHCTILLVKSPVKVNVPLRWEAELLLPNTQD